MRESMQNKNLILPVAGSSSRFPNMMPKYLLKDPSGNFMLTKSIEGISPDCFDQVIIVALQEHEKKYNFSNLQFCNFVNFVNFL